MLRKCYQKCVGLMIKIPYLRTSKLSKGWLDHILDIFFNYFNVIKGVLFFSVMRPTKNFFFERVFKRANIKKCSCLIRTFFL